MIDGKALAQGIRERIAKDVVELHAKTGIRPGLAAILVAPYAMYATTLGRKD